MIDAQKHWSWMRRPAAAYSMTKIAVGVIDLSVAAIISVAIASRILCASTKAVLYWTPRSRDSARALLPADKSVHRLLLRRSRDRI